MSDSSRFLSRSWPWGLAVALLAFSAWACLASWRVVQSDAHRGGVVDVSAATVPLAVPVGQNL